MDKIVDDLKTEEEILDSLKSSNDLDSNIDSIWKDLEVDTTEQEKYEADVVLSSTDSIDTAIFYTKIQQIHSYQNNRFR